MYLFNLLDRAAEIDNAFVDAHLEAVPGISTLSTGSLAASDAQRFSGNADGSSRLVAHFLGLGQDLAAHILECLNLLGR